jgi:proton-dependent oligopeptide transporter, POT family
MMGGWFLAVSVGNKLSGILSSTWEHMENKANFFLMNFGLVFLAFLLMAAMLKWLNRIMKEKGLN